MCVPRFIGGYSAMVITRIALLYIVGNYGKRTFPVSTIVHTIGKGGFYSLRPDPNG